MILWDIRLYDDAKRKENMKKFTFENVIPVKVALNNFQKISLIREIVRQVYSKLTILYVKIQDFLMLSNIQLIDFKVCFNILYYSVSVDNFFYENAVYLGFLIVKFSLG